MAALEFTKLAKLSCNLHIPFGFKLMYFFILAGNMIFISRKVITVNLTVYLMKVYSVVSKL